MTGKPDSQDDRETGDLLPIGEVARIFGLRASALRYYEELGLISPAARQANRRYYGLDQLRRLVLIQLCHGTGQLSLNDVATLIDGSRSGTQEEWREVMRQRVAQLDEQIKRAKEAQSYLEHFAGCQHGSPVAECPVLRHSLQKEVERRLSQQPPDSGYAEGEQCTEDPAHDDAMHLARSASHVVALRAAH